MKRRRVQKDREKRSPSVEENLSVQATDEDNSIKIDAEMALEEFRRLAEVKDE